MLNATIFNFIMVPFTRVWQGRIRGECWMANRRFALARSLNELTHCGKGTTNNSLMRGNVNHLETARLVLQRASLVLD
jgi:hypothetical protein